MIVVASVLLGAVFVVAGVTKLAAPQQWQAQSSDLGVSRIVAVVVPYVETMIGALLIAQIARRPVAMVAGAVLAGFTALVVVRLLQGKHPPCACFGAWSSKPIGWSNIVRNAAFLVLAAVVAFGLV